MDERGYAYPDPLAALADSRWRKGKKPTETELRTAVADQQRRAKENVVGIWFSVNREYQERAVANHAKELAAAKKSIDRKVDAARRALAD
ncbi:hypothetical protein [Streptomyces yatensis]|uniref:Uncharacterized protein n=1 Tax=Streptomyces yatensis TaxID=155177 RepID=A0ABN2IMV8_9ACTN|nr:hypothetical protein [Streptomyces yatensis]